MRVAAYDPAETGDEADRPELAQRPEGQVAPRHAAPTSKPMSRSEICWGGSRTMVGDQASVGDHEDPVGVGGRDGVVADHRDRLAVLTGGGAQQVRTSRELRESRLPVGSSAKMTAGREAARGRWRRAAAARPRARSAGGPPGRRGRGCARGGRSTGAPRSTCRPASSNGSSTFSLTDSVGTRLKAWKTKPTWLRRKRVRALSSSRDKVAPPSTTSPLVTSSRPAATFIRVDLPDPDGPMMAVKSPRRMSTVTSSRATTAPCPTP